MSDTIRIRRALFSAYTKSGIVSLAKEVVRWKGEVIASGGTADVLTEGGVAVRTIESITGVGSLFGGRVKTLHPKVHGGILFRRDDPADVRAAEEAGIEPIDLVVVNLYPFTSALERRATEDETIELIDIGGPAMVRAAAKNHAHVAVVTAPDDYARVQAALRQGEGRLSVKLLRELAGKAFRVTSEYDAAISEYLSRGEETIELPSAWSVHLPLQRELRYGENPSQKGGLYGAGVGFPFELEQLHGKELSYNNYLDLACGRDTIAEFQGELTAVVIKHGIPCGVAHGESLEDAYVRARAGDSLSAFGGVVTLNRVVDDATAVRLNETFLEVVLAPGFADDALQILRKKKNRILLRCPSDALLQPDTGLRGRFVGNGVLLQTPLAPKGGEDDWKVVTKRGPDDREVKDLRFAWRVLRNIRSNGVMFAKDGQTLGVGSGQTSRIDAVESAIAKATREGHDLTGSVLVSDAFFPFSDSVARAASVGATAVLQPGGSVNDTESIEACDRLGLTMVTNGFRVFSHG
ncbi:MAG: bifunctional phosphoribosylaminoimidazolecarboxamide formyltransferase/IMP cyclohydrolase [Candidatus Eisenbacteria bacterium]